MLNNAQRRRRHKFDRQFGRCHWCGCQMSMDPIKPNGKANPLYATFEHLQRRKDGGNGKPMNVVLAHASCNRKRETPRFEMHVANMKAFLGEKRC